MLHELKRRTLGPILIFLHGFLGNALDWIEVAAELPFTCLALNLPGHGNEPFTPNVCEYLLQETKHHFPLNLIGYSMGGRLALQFAALYPEKINSLTLISSHLGLKSGQYNRLAKDRALAQKLMSLPIDEFLTIWYDQPIFKTLVAKMDIRSMRKNQNPEDLARALETYSLGHQPDLSHIILHAKSFLNFESHHGGPSSSHRSSPILRQYGAPRDNSNLDHPEASKIQESSRVQYTAHLIAGELDHDYRTHYQPFPHTIIPKAGHAVHLEKPPSPSRSAP